MERRRYFELRTLDEKAFFGFCLVEKESGNEKPKTTEQKQDSRKGNSKEGNNNNGDLMTEPQKRYLFRILADQGIEGDKAHERLKELFQSDSLKEVTKLEASRVIEGLLAEGVRG